MGEGLTAGGEVFSQTVVISYEGQDLCCRRIVVKLEQPTRDGETEIALLTNLPPDRCFFYVGGTIVSKTLAGRNFISGGRARFSTVKLRLWAIPEKNH